MCLITYSICVLNGLNINNSCSLIGFQPIVKICLLRTRPRVRSQGALNAYVPQFMTFASWNMVEMMMVDNSILDNMTTLSFGPTKITGSSSGKHQKKWLLKKVIFFFKKKTVKKKSKIPLSKGKSDVLARQAVVGSRKPAGDLVAVGAPPGGLALPDARRPVGLGLVAPAALHRVRCGYQRAASGLQRLGFLRNVRFRHGRCHGLGWQNGRGFQPSPARLQDSRSRPGCTWLNITARVVGQRLRS